MGRLRRPSVTRARDLLGDPKRVVRQLRIVARPAQPLLGPALEPTFLVIGAQKGGTTSLFSYLARHPDVAAPATKEIDYFGCPARHARGTDFYHSHFPRRWLGRGRVTFEASPDYLASADAAGRIHAYRPEMKLIALVRDPVERAYSAWNMYRGLYRRDRMWFADWVRRCHGDVPGDARRPRSPTYGEDFEADVREELDAVGAERSIDMPVLTHGYYRAQLDAYLRVFPHEQLLVERSEDFLADPVAVLGRVETFVGLTPLAWDAGALRRELAGAYDRPVPEGARRLLAEVYAEPNRRLGEMLGRELDWT